MSWWVPSFKGAEWNLCLVRGCYTDSQLDIVKKSLLIVIHCEQCSSLYQIRLKRFFLGT